jgi:3-oxoadipate enol-lactonase
MLLAHEDEGSGSSVVLLHSGVADRRMWQATAVRLRAARRVVRPDLRGFGDSPLPAEAFGFSEDVVALLDHLGVERTSLVGSSFGGLVALDLAARWPDRVASLVLLCPAFRGLEPTQTARRFGTEEDALLESGDIDGAVELNVRTWLGPDAGSETPELVRHMQRHAFDVQLAAESGESQPEAAPMEPDPALVTAPTLVVSGALDMDHFQNIARHLASTIPGAQLATLPWAAHLPSLERPEETTALVEEFLSVTGG